MNVLKTICVTGANGFIGRAVSIELLKRNHFVHGAVRSQKRSIERAVGGLKFFEVGKIGEGTDWSAALAGVDCVIHCAARAHVIRETKADALEAYRAVNARGTARLAEQAAPSGVRRFVFLSSIGVLGTHTNNRGPFSVMDEPSPAESYAISKFEAEHALREISARTGLEVVILRSPLVYGPGAKGNFARLLELMGKGIPLPLGAIDNQRSLLGIDNLVDLLIRCVSHPRAAGQTFLASDGEDISTTDLLCLIAKAMGRAPRLIPVPVPLLRIVGRATGKSAEIERLVGSLLIDSSQTREILGWQPPVSLSDGIQRSVDWYMAQR